jgi:chromosome segregation ATPase
MKNTNDTQLILSAINGLGDRMGGLESRIDRLESKVDRLESKQEETTEALQSLASHMDKRFDESNHQMMNLFRTADRKVDNLINALAKKKILTRPEANTLMAAGPVV